MRRRIRSLDLLKILGASLIVLHHYQQIFFEVPRAPVPYYGGRFFLGYLVELFFFLSGFLMRREQRRIEAGLGFRPFFLRRYLRLIPVAAVSTLVYALLCRGLQSADLSRFGELEALFRIPAPAGRSLAVTLLGVQSWLPEDPGLNNVLWYVSVLLACYLLFYAAIRLATRLGVSPLAFFAALSLLGFIAQRCGLGCVPFLSLSMGRGYYAFFPGLLFAALTERRPLGPRAELAGAAIVACFAAAFFVPGLRGPLSGRYGFLLPVLVYPALVTVFLTDGAKRLFDRPWIGTLGAVSYDVYVWHLTGIVLLVCLGQRLPLAPFFLTRAGMYAYLLLIWLFGALSHVLLEKPLDRRFRALEQALFGGE